MLASRLLCLLATLSTVAFSLPSTEPDSVLDSLTILDDDVPGIEERDTAPDAACYYTPCTTDVNIKPQCKPGESAKVSLRNGCPWITSSTRGQSYLCCPSSDKPNCRSSATGILCNNKCFSTEVVVGYDDSKCTGKGDQLCCTKTKSLAPQSQCKWADTCGADKSNATCPTGYTEAVAWVNDGLGPGTYKCSSGQYRPYCCLSPPAPYQNCTKYNVKGASVALQDGKCSGQCLDGQVLIASDSDGCKSGQNAWCCATPMIQGDRDYLAIQDQIRSIASNPQCPAKAAPNASKRSEQSALDEASVEKRVDTTVTQFVPQLVVDAMMDRTYNLSTSYNNTMIGRAWDELMNTSVLPFAEIGARIYADSGQYNPSSTADGVVCDDDRAQDQQDVLNATSQLCMLEFGNKTRNTYNQTKSTSRRSETFDLSKRRFVDGVRTVANNPRDTHIGTIMRAVIGGNYNGANHAPLPLLYTRTFLDPGNAQDTILEIAYDVRGRPELQGGDPANIFAVFHFHTRRLRLIQYDQHDLPFPIQDYVPEIPRFHVFHGQQVANLRTAANPLWAVRWYPRGSTAATPNPNRGEVRRMVILNCQRINNGVPPAQQVNWYPGYGMAWRDDPTPGPPGGQANAAGLINDFGNYLVQQRILGPTTYRNWNDDTQQWNPIDPNTNQNRMPDGSPPHNMDPSGPDHFPS